MKKGLLITVDFWPRVGGASYYYRKLLEFPKTHVLDVLTTPLPSGVVEEKSPFSDSIKVHRRPFLFSWIWPRWLRLLWEIFRLTKKEQYQFFLVGDILPVGAAVFFFSRVFRIPYSVCIHGTDLMYASRNFQKKILAAKILKRAKIIITNSEYTKKQIEKFDIFPSKIQVLYPCIDIESDPNELNRKKEQIIEKFNLKERPLILTVSRLVERKGIQYALDAFSRAKEEFPEAKYVIVGNGPYLDLLKKRISDLNLEENVHLLTDVFDEQEKYAWYAIADLFLLAPVQLENGDYEGFGIVYLEAAYFGLPIIGSRCGGVPEAVLDGKTGVLVNSPKDRREFSEKIKDLLQDEKKRKMLGQEGQRRVQEKFLCRNMNAP